MQGLYRKAVRYKGQCGIIKTAVLAPPFESVEKVDTLLVEDAVRSKIFDFRTALYPRQYHPCTLEKPLVKRLFAYKVFFRRTCRRKNKIRLTAAKKLNLRFIDSLKSRFLTEPGFFKATPHNSG